jgi:hypothetical protein
MNSRGEGYVNYYKNFGPTAATVFQNYQYGRFTGWRMVFDNKHFYNYDWTGNPVYLMAVAEGAFDFFMRSHGFLPCRWNGEQANTLQGLSHPPACAVH